MLLGARRSAGPRHEVRGKMQSLVLWIATLGCPATTDLVDNAPKWALVAEQASGSASLSTPQTPHSGSCETPALRLWGPGWGSA